MSRWLTRLGARVIGATRMVDRGYRLFDRVRSEVVLAWASDEVLARYNDLAYGEAREYRPDSADFRGHLFPWEQRAIDCFFPPPPARVLVGGAGGGREPFALAAMGYEVVAFEPSRSLAEAMAGRVPDPARVTVYRGGYEDLPWLFPAGPGERGACLDELPPFEAGIVGWGSFSHLRSEEQRLKTLQGFARATRGPILVSFFSRSEPVPGAARPGRLRRLLPGRPDRGPGDSFSPFVGYHHRFSKAELLSLARRAGLEVAHLSMEDSADWHHAVLVSGSEEP